MRFVRIKSAEQQGQLMQRRTRDVLIRQRTQIINALRAHLAELGFVAAQGNAGVNELRAIVTDEAGRNRAAWWPRSSGTRASYIPALASSSPTCRARPSGSSPLQQARDVRAMDQARQGSDQVDAAVMLLVRRQRCAPQAGQRPLHRAPWPLVIFQIRSAEGIVPRDQTLALPEAIKSSASGAGLQSRQLHADRSSAISRRIWRGGD